MHFNFALLALVSAVTVSAYATSPLDARSKADVQTVLKDLKGISKDAAKLLSALQDTDGTDVFTDLDIQKIAQKLEDDIDAATKVGEKVSKSDVTTADAQSFYDTLVKLEPTAKAVCTRAAKLKPGFKQAGVLKQVQELVSGIPPRVNKIGKLTLSLAPASFKSKGQKLLKLYEKDEKICTSAYPPS